MATASGPEDGHGRTQDRLVEVGANFHQAFLRMWVYKRTNTINGKGYVGQTRKASVQKRLSEHKNAREGQGRERVGLRTGIIEISPICSLHNEEGVSVMDGSIGRGGRNGDLLLGVLADSRNFAHKRRR